MNSSPDPTRPKNANGHAPLRPPAPSRRRRREKRIASRTQDPPCPAFAHPENATAEEALERFAAMGESERKYLLGYASSLIWKTTFSEPMDLLHEALDLTLAGRRKWALRVAFPVHMASSMRSIAWARRARDEATLALDIDVDAAFESGIGGVCCASAEEVAIAREESLLWTRVIEAALNMLGATDELAHGVLLGLVDGGKARQLRVALKIDAALLDAARKRVLRTLRRSARL